MSINPLSQDFVSDLLTDGHITDYGPHMKGTGEEAVKVVSHSGKIATLLDNGSMISYSIYENVEDYNCDEYDHLGAIEGDDGREEFLALLK